MYFGRWRVLEGVAGLLQGVGGLLQGVGIAREQRGDRAETAREERGKSAESARRERGKSVGNNVKAGRESRWR